MAQQRGSSEVAGINEPGQAESVNEGLSLVGGLLLSERSNADHAVPGKQPSNGGQHKTTLRSLTAVGGAGAEVGPLHPVKLEASQGPEHPYSVIEALLAKRDQGVPATMLSGRALDGGAVNYDKAGNITSWTSPDQAVTRSFTYTDSKKQLDQLPRPGFKVDVGPNGMLSQLQGSFATGFINLPITKEQFYKTQQISQVLSKVEDNQGHIWTRNASNGLMEEMRTNAGGQLESMGTFATDKQLIPQTIPSTDGARLYADQAHPQRSISAYGINQGLLGDCYFEATLASLAQQNPQAIRSMIKDNQDGTFTVNFPRTPNSAELMAKRVPQGASWPELEAGVAVRVEAPTKMEIEAFNRTRWKIPSFAKLPQGEATPPEGSSVGYWATVVEKAHRYLTGRVAGDSGDIPRLSHMLLTGMTTGATSFTNFMQDDLRPSAAVMKTKPDASWADNAHLYSDGELGQRIQSALRQGKAIVASTPADGNEWVHSASIKSGAADDSYLIPSHAYSVMSYLPGDSHQAPQVILRNPWGLVATLDKSGKPHLLGGRDADGYFQVSLQDFSKLFRSVDVGG